METNGVVEVTFERALPDGMVISRRVAKVDALTMGDFSAYQRGAINQHDIYWIYHNPTDKCIGPFLSEDEVKRYLMELSQCPGTGLSDLDMVASLIADYLDRKNLLDLVTSRQSMYRKSLLQGLVR